MHYVLFSGKAIEGQGELGGKYYAQLQPILHNKIEGFVDETPFGNPSDANESVLFARFTDEEAMARWRNNSTHLKIMHHARHNVYSAFNIIIGSDKPSSSSETHNEGEMMLVYQRPATAELEPQHMQLSHITREPSHSPSILDSNFFAGEHLHMWIARLADEMTAKDIEETFERVSGDALHRIYIIREYSKADRKQAPPGLDEAEAQAGEEEPKA